MLRISGVLRRPTKGWIPTSSPSYAGIRLRQSLYGLAHSLRTLHTTMQKPLDYSSGPLVWIDCEMTGLDPTKDKILEIAVSSYDEQHMGSQHLSGSGMPGSHHRRES